MSSLGLVPPISKFLVVFNIESNEFFSENNLQEETNLHNLKIGDVKINRILSTLMVSVFSVYFLLFQWLYVKVKWFKRLIDQLGIPIPTMSQTAAMVMITMIILVIEDRRRWEVWESVFTTVLFWTFLQPYQDQMVETTDVSANEGS